MGARFIATTVQGSKGFFNCKVNKGETELTFDYQPANENTFKQYKAYAPSRDDYEISVAIVDKAISLGCDLIVYDNWIHTTISGSQHALINRIPVYSVPEFIKKIKSRERLETE